MLSHVSSEDQRDSPPHCIIHYRQIALLVGGSLRACIPSIQGHIPYRSGNPARSIYEEPRVIPNRLDSVLRHDDQIWASVANQITWMILPDHDKGVVYIICIDDSHSS